MKGLPDRPPTPDLSAYVRLAAAGWLLTRPLRSGNRFRHAVGGSFDAYPAADAAWMMDLLAGLTTDSALAQRLRSTAAAASAEVPADQRLFAAVGHVRYPLAPLVLGPVPSSPSATTSTNPVLVSLDQAREIGRSLVRRFQPDGSIRYRAPAGGVDYGRTHFSDEASGLTAEPVYRLLEAGGLRR